VLRAWAFPTVLYSLLWASICPRLLKCWLCRVVRAPAGWLIPPRLAMQPEPTTAVLYRKNNCVQTSRLQSITTWAAFFQKKNYLGRARLDRLQTGWTLVGDPPPSRQMPLTYQALQVPCPTSRDENGSDKI
jgi:hypothetical protein